jgi:hypothetical protein
LSKSWRPPIPEGPDNNALQLTRARSAQEVRAARHNGVPHRASIIYGPSQLNAVFCGHHHMDRGEVEAPHNDRL